MPYRVLLVDDHPMFRWGVRQFIESLPEFEFIAEAADGLVAFQILETTAIDVVLLDLEMPGLDGTKFLTELTKSSKKKPKIIVLSQTSDALICKKLRTNGIDGYVLKTDGIDEIANALSAITRSETYFSQGIAKRLWEILNVETAPTSTDSISAREREIAHLVCQGLSTQEIADKLGCAPSTVKTHRANLIRKTRVKNSAELAVLVASTT